jgi:hypothetical protein
MDNTIELEKLKTRVEKLTKEHQLEILKILHSAPDVKLNENKSGVYINLSFLPKDIITNLQIYLDYVQDQEKMLLLAESKKEDFVKAYFESDNEDSPAISANTTI